MSPTFSYESDDWRNRVGFATLKSTELRSCQPSPTAAPLAPPHRRTPAQPLRALPALPRARASSRTARVTCRPSCRTATRGWASHCAMSTSPGQCPRRSARWDAPTALDTRSSSAAAAYSSRRHGALHNSEDSRSVPRHLPCPLSPRRPRVLREDSTALRTSPRGRSSLPLCVRRAFSLRGRGTFAGQSRTQAATRTLPTARVTPTPSKPHAKTPTMTKTRICGTSTRAWMALTRSVSSMPLARKPSTTPRRSLSKRRTAPTLRCEKPPWRARPRYRELSSVKRGCPARKRRARPHTLGVSLELDANCAVYGHHTRRIANEFNPPIGIDTATRPPSRSRGCHRDPPPGEPHQGALRDGDILHRHEHACVDGRLYRRAQVRRTRVP
ncbi:hypothetical protein PsYK624_150130 [Phanerochaete sordida]|uniref:Uncharacterized protein n=1 Tax=Phanerochaete sordida TaxID=48140 RepID=A0A9P3GNJ3_9APHY|nr:hypothetical protein PsYK624_150130 [Phanerochaete sordida]